MPDWFTDKNGRVHAIRSSPGYDEALVGLREADKAYLRDGESSYTCTSPGREVRIAEAASKPRSLPTRLSAEAQEHRFTPRYKSKLY
jgi:hypothetical protein